MELLIDFLAAPADVRSVLRHLEARGSHATGVDSLARSEEHAIVLEEVDSARLAAHVGDLAAAPGAVGLQFLRVVFRKLVLESAREGDVAFHAPGLLARGEDSLARELGSHVLDLVAVRSTHHKHVVDHFLGDTVGNLADTVRAGDGDDLRTKFSSLGGSAPSHVAEAGQSHGAALDVLAGLVQQVLGEIEGTETGSLRTEDRTAPGSTLASEHTRVVLAGELLVHTVEITDLTAADTDVTGRDVLIRADALPQLGHEGLAETHDLVVALADRVEVGTTLGTTHREGRQGVLEGLLETEELQHRRGNGFVETQTALVRADRAVELNAITEVGLHFARIVNPRHTEREDPVRLDHPLDDLCLLEFRMLVVHFLDGVEDLADSLEILALTGVLPLKVRHNFSYFHD